MAYAENTSVSVERTRAEIETILSKHRATKFGYMTDDGGARLMFVLANRAIRFTLPLPSRSADEFIHRMVRGQKKLNSVEDGHKRWEQACRSRWRALFLCIKAKLEAIDVGISTFEEEFLAHVVLASGKTIGQEIIPRLDKIQGGAPMLTLEK